MTSSDSPAILFYISGHGFGHAIRALDICNRIDPAIRVIISCGAPKWLADIEQQRPWEYTEERFDIGAIQSDSLAVHVRETLEAYQAQAAANQLRLPGEIERVKQNNVQLIIGDIPPFAFQVAGEAGVPGWGITNFSCDWVYAPYVDQYPEFKPMRETICSDYAKADLLLELPLTGDLNIFPNREKVPLVARNGIDVRAELIESFGLPSDQKLALISFGGMGLERIDYDQVASLTDWTFLSYTPSLNYPHNVRQVRQGTFRHQDVTASVDVVFSKPGYGIVAEVMAHGVPLVFTTRGKFCEYCVMLKEICDWGGGIFIDQDHLLAGKWEETLEAVECLGRLKPLPADGARVCAEKINALVLG